MKDQPKTITPKLRFPEFKEPWGEVTLSDLAVPISDRVGTSECVPYTVTSGVGLVSQHEKLGRTIAGKSLSNYIRLRKDDFAYNKSATKAFPEGYIARYLDDVQAAVPKSIFTCFRADPGKIDPAYLDFLFAGNLHGKWLRKFLTVGARAHGSLNVKDDDLMAMPVPRPSPAEQRKIAACLTSLDELLVAEGRKLEALRAHKKGLMQQLFPRPGETLPRLRFPEFREAGEWEPTLFKKLYEFQSTNNYSREQLTYESGNVRNIHYGDIHTRFAAAFYLEREVAPFVDPAMVSDDFDADAYCVEGDMIFADASEDVNDVGKSIEIVSLNGGRLVSGSHTILARPTSDRIPIGFGAYLFKSRSVRAQIEKEAQGTKVMQISPRRLADITLPLPHDKAEQERIVACLSSLDAVIAAASRMLERLRANKKGLMQQLFPSPEGA
jgi:type I restriction enzyme S subunit